jgi:transcriptional regulator GlxA family with amidase domain
MRIDILVYDGFDELDAVGPMEVLRGAKAAGADLEVRLLSRTSMEHVTASFGLRLVPDGVFMPGEAPIVIVPGGGWAARNDVGTWGEVQRGDWLPILADAATHSTMVSVCTGAMLLAHAGIIGTRPCTTHAAALDDLRATGADVRDARVVDDGDLITGAGVTSGIDVALHLVARFVGEESADSASRRLEYPRTPALMTGPITE